MIVSGNWDSASCFKPERELTRSIDIRQLFKTENSTLDKIIYKLEGQSKYLTRMPSTYLKSIGNRR